MTERALLGRKDITSDARRIQALFGTLYAGGGIVKLSSDGIRILTAATYGDARSYQFQRADETVVSRLAGYYNDVGNVNSAELLVNSVAGYDSAGRVRVESPAGEDAQAVVSAYHAAGSYADVVADVSTGNVASVFAVIDGTIRLNVDAGGVDVTGTLAVTGAITATTTITATGDVQGDEIKTDGANTDGSQRWQLGGRQPSADFAMTGYVEVWISGSKWLLGCATG